MTDIRGLSLYQPYASLIELGAKTIETRSWPTSYRGWLAIHAAKAFPTYHRDLCELPPFDRALHDGGFGHDYRDDVGSYFRIEMSRLPRGAIIAVARIVVILDTGPADEPATWPGGLSRQERAFGDYTPARYGWLLTDVHRLPEPIPCTGRQRLWRVPPDIVAQIEAQLPGVLR